ncbi:unnamed protein product, partial [Rotaria sp. Silwood2]
HDTVGGFRFYRSPAMFRKNPQFVMAMNPRNYYQSYVVDGQSTVWQTLDFGATWTDVTGTLFIDSGSREMPYAWGSIFIPMRDNNALAVGTALGVYIAFDNQMGTTTKWYKLGLSIPNVLVSSFVYDSTKDLLVASTMGRGWWTLSQI